MKALSKHLVFYGFAKLTKKAIRKRSIIIQYANTSNYNDRQKRYIEQKMHIVYQRYQTKEEAEESKNSNRSWTKWEYFVDDKRWKGNIEAILHDNFVAEVNNVSLKERTEIKEKLEKGYYDFYQLKREPKGQQQLLFE
jgi:hypothetical protein